MAGLMEQLIDVLSTQLANYDVLLALSESKKDAIISNEAEGLQKITSEENTLVGRVQKLDKSRISIMREIGVVLNIADKNYTLTHLSELIKGQAEYDTLIELITGTKERLDKLKLLNNQNKTLLENSLEYIDYSVNVMRSSVDAGKRFYNTSGDEIGPVGGFFDARQ